MTPKNGSTTELLKLLRHWHDEVRRRAQGLYEGQWRAIQDAEDEFEANLHELQRRAEENGSTT